VVRVGILFLGLLLTLASMAHSLPFGGVFFRLLDGAATTTVPYGSTVSMKGVFANGTGLIKDQDLTTTFDSVVSGTTYTTLPLTSSKTYTLTVSNPAGDSVTAHVDVTVTPLSVGGYSDLGKCDAQYPEAVHRDGHQLRGKRGQDRHLDRGRGPQWK